MTGWNLPPGCSIRDIDPPAEALELTIDGVLYAWDEDDNVYVYTGATDHDYDDGFRRIGTLPWPDDDNWELAFRRWVLDYRKSNAEEDGR